MIFQENRRSSGASLPVVLAIIIIVVCVILLIVPQFVKQDNTQSETIILGYERTARNAAREAFTLGSDSLGEAIDKNAQVAFVVDSKGKRIYALKENETLTALKVRLESRGVEPFENYGEALTLTSPDPWQTRFVSSTEVSSDFVPGDFWIGEEMKVGKTYDLRDCLLFVSVHEDKKDHYEYYLWWQATGDVKLLKESLTD
ncbi:hypothetical protein SAMN05421767_11513 [Granulicatella balaenopterae]|uniref:Uncharacterized protein n=1 Tax=Granulicatella balaenopterae TaxID=137733 RepID=A0A1H9KRC8_9LACT|nr:hypothetical protein [Granulicatella balaenopterae]SER01662.1 hypothetical protein SAMN05421767_11513 [Granulicatella balaenopterae]